MGVHEDSEPSRNAAMASVVVFKPRSYTTWFGEEDAQCIARDDKSQAQDFLPNGVLSLQILTALATGEGFT
jgi:hypothetical protein